MNRKAYKAVIRARTVLLVSQPFYGCLAMHLNIVEIDDAKQCPTMAVDGINMYYNPAFVLSLSEEELVGVIAHETTHCAYQHMTRRGQRHLKIWNYAGDYVINADLLKANFVLPQGRLHDPRFDGMSTEEVYERIKDNFTIITVNIGGDGSGSGGEKGDCDPTGCGAVWDAAPQHDKATTDKVAGEWEATVRMAVAVAKAANAGLIPGNLDRLTRQLKKPKVSVRELTRQFIDGTMIRDYSWARPNRRYLGSGLTLPGFIPDAMHHLVMFADNSGSISDDLIGRYLGIVASALDEGVADKLTVVYADAKVQHVDEFFVGDAVEPKPVKGGGGTCFKDSFRWLRENAPDASCVIYLTDMCTSAWGEEPECPVLWAAFVPEQSLKHYKPPFGTVIHFDGTV